MLTVLKEEKSVHFSHKRQGLWLALRHRVSDGRTASVPCQGKVSPAGSVICVWPFIKAGALGLTETSQSSRMFIDLQILKKHGSSDLNYVSVVSSC